MDEANPYSASSSGDQRNTHERRWRWTPLRIGFALLGTVGMMSFMAPRNIDLADARAQGEAFGRGMVQLITFVAAVGFMLYHIVWRRRQNERN